MNEAVSVEGRCNAPAHEGIRKAKAHLQRQCRSDPHARSAPRAFRQAPRRVSRSTHHQRASVDGGHPIATVEQAWENEGAQPRNAVVDGKHHAHPIRASTISRILHARSAEDPHRHNRRRIDSEQVERVPGDMAGILKGSPSVDRGALISMFKLVVDDTGLASRGSITHSLLDVSSRAPCIPSHAGVCAAGHDQLPCRCASEEHGVWQGVRVQRDDCRCGRSGPIAGGRKGNDRPSGPNGATVLVRHR